MKSAIDLEKIKAFILDLDGVLYNSTVAWIKTERKIAKQLGITPPKKEIQWKLFGKSIKERVKKLFPGHQKKALKLFFGEERKNFLSEFKLFRDAKRLLRYLKNKNIKTAIATGLDKNALNIIFKKDTLLKFVDFAISSEEVGKEKPHPKILLRILKKFKLKPSEVLYIGDALSDIETARRAKIKSVIITRGAIKDPKKAKELGADYVFNNFSELLYSIK